MILLNCYYTGAVAVAGSYFGPGTGSIVLDNIECEGTEEMLHQCPHGGLAVHDCTNIEHASVICQCEQLKKNF